MAIVIRVWSGDRKQGYLGFERETELGVFFGGSDYLPYPDRATVVAALDRGEVFGEVLGGNTGAPCRWELVERDSLRAPELTADQQAYRDDLRAEWEAQKPLSVHGGAGSLVASRHGFSSRAELASYLAAEFDLPRQRIPVRYVTPRPA